MAYARPNVIPSWNHEYISKFFEGKWAACEVDLRSPERQHKSAHGNKPSPLPHYHRWGDLEQGPQTPPTPTELLHGQKTRLSRWAGSVCERQYVILPVLDFKIELRLHLGGRRTGKQTQTTPASQTPTFNQHGVMLSMQSVFYPLMGLSNLSLPFHMVWMRCVRHSVNLPCSLTADKPRANWKNLDQIIRFSQSVRQLRCVCVTFIQILGGTIPLSGYTFMSLQPPVSKL